MLFFLLYNCGLELLDSLPLKIQKHAAIKNDIKKRKKKQSEILLDLAIHQSAFNSKDQLNRGRPDIVHQCVLQFLFSSLIHPSEEHRNINKPRLLIHSINNTYFEVSPLWRPPTHYLRFRGLLEQLYSQKSLKISNEESLLLKTGSLNKIITSINPQKIVIFSSHGKESPQTLHTFAKNIYSYHTDPDPILCLIGGYQHGPPPKLDLPKINKINTKITYLTLEGGRLPSWKVLSKALQGIEWENNF